MNMQAESLARNALALDYIRVEAEVLIGIPPALKPQWSITTMKCPEPTILYCSLSQVFFDHADLDEALLNAIANQDRKPADVLLRANSIAEIFLGNGISQPTTNVLDKAYEQINPAIFWNSDSARQIPIVQFIEDRVPFVRTREWLYKRFREIIAADSDRFIGHIGIKARPVYAVGG